MSMTTCGQLSSNMDKFEKQAGKTGVNVYADLLWLVAHSWRQVSFVG